MMKPKKTLLHIAIQVYLIPAISMEQVGVITVLEGGISRITDLPHLVVSSGQLAEKMPFACLQYTFPSA